MIGNGVDEMIGIGVVDGNEGPNGVDEGYDGRKGAGVDEGYDGPNGDEVEEGYDGPNGDGVEDGYNGPTNGAGVDDG